MIPLDEYKMNIEAFGERLGECREALNPDKVRAELTGLEEQMGAADFWNDVDSANKVNQRAKQLQHKLDRFRKLYDRFEDLKTLIEMAEEEQDDSLVGEIKSETAAVSAAIESLRLEQMLKGPYDGSNAILSLHAGAGGTEAQDWTEMLYRMYTRYCENRGWAVRELDRLEGEDAGVKSVTFEVDGENAYGYLKAEKGVHRLVRISPFDASGRRHTSFASLDVTPILDDDSNVVDIDPDDLRVDTYRSSGAGGQHVNKTESAIRITHLPTGMVVSCQDEKSQLKNKEQAMRVLKSRLYEHYRAQHDAERAGERKSQIGSGDRSERIRTYNFPQGRVTDHRIGLTLYRLETFLDGDMDELIDALILAERSAQLSGESE